MSHAAVIPTGPGASSTQDVRIKAGTAQLGQHQKTSLPSYSASLVDENPLFQLNRLLDVKANGSRKVDGPDQGQTSAQTVARETLLQEKLIENLSLLNQSIVTQSSSLERVIKLAEDAVMLSIEHRTHARMGAINTARLYNAQMTAIANASDTGARFAPLAEVPNSNGLYPKQYKLPLISSAQVLLALNLAQLKEYNIFYGLPDPVCIVNRSKQRELDLHRHALSKHLGCYSLVGMSAAEFGGIDS